MGLMIFCAEKGIAQQLNSEVMLELVNAARKKGCKCGNQYFAATNPLSWNKDLEKAAVAHSKDMKKNNFFSHTGSDGSAVSNRIEKAGYQWMAFGENIGLGYTSEKEAVAAWLKSPGHCKNIMSPKFSDFGAARVGLYWTQVFGKKLKN